MTTFSIVVITLTGLYLLMLTSVHPGDVLVGAILSTLVAAVTRSPTSSGGPPLHRRLVAAPALAATVVADVVRGTWRVIRCCINTRISEEAGLVAMPITGRSSIGVAASGILAGLSADELIVDIDEDRDVMLVHVLDARDPEAVRTRHRAFYEHRQRQVIP